DGEHRAIGHAGDGAQACLDLLELDTVSVQLDLSVEPSGAGEGAIVGIDPAEIAGAVGVTTVRKSDERRGAGVGRQVAGRDLRSGDDDLPVRTVAKDSQGIVRSGDPDVGAGRRV